MLLDLPPNVIFFQPLWSPYRKLKLVSKPGTLILQLRLGTKYVSMGQDWANAQICRSLPAAELEALEGIINQLLSYLAQGSYQIHIESWFADFCNALANLLRDPDGQVTPLDCLTLEVHGVHNYPNEIGGFALGYLLSLAKICYAHTRFDIPNQSKVFRDYLFVIDAHSINFGPSVISPLHHL